MFWIVGGGIASIHARTEVLVGVVQSSHKTRHLRTYVSDDLDCELPDDFEESDRYLQIPHKNDLDLGRRLVDEFVAARAPHLTNAAADAFHRRGAYGKWKSMLESEGLLDSWYKFENQRATEAIANWCVENHLPLESGTATEESNNGALRS